jgi:carboxyl-terminal processing protease
MQVFEKGPADRAGIVANELIEEIEGEDTKGMSVTEAVERLRGEEGTEVAIKVRPPKAKEGRPLTLRREKLARETITGVRKRPAGGWDLRLDGPEAIGYLRIGEILDSTPHELRQVASRLESEGTRALVLDLRNCGHANLHATVLLGDEFLDRGMIGLVREADKVTTYRANPDALFRGWPVVVLIDGGTMGPAEWLAAALQDNHRATLVGSPTRGSADVRTTLPLADGTWSIQMTTGRLERGDGRAIGTPEGPGPQAIARRMPSPNDRKGGVQPDHPMTPTRPVFPGRGPNAPARAEPAKVTDDPWIKKAMDIIRNDMGSV